MPESRRVLALDVGTQSARAIVFDACGQIVARAQQSFHPYFSPQPGWAEQEVAVYWDALKICCHRLWHEQGVGPDSIEALALTTNLPAGYFDGFGLTNNGTDSIDIGAGETRSTGDTVSLPQV